MNQSNPRNTKRNALNRFLFALAVAALVLSCSNHKPAAPASKRARRKSESASEPGPAAKKLNVQGNEFYYLRVYDSAFVYYRAALPLAEQSGNSDRIFATVQNLANTFNDAAWTRMTREEVKSDLDSAAYYYGRALEVVRTMDDSAREALLLMNMGIFYWSPMAMLPRAESLLDQALAIYRSLGVPGKEAEVLYNRGMVRGSRVNLVAARQDFVDALALTRKTGAMHDLEAWCEYHIAGCDTLLSGQREMSRSEWRAFVQRHQREWQDMQKQIGKLKVADPLRSGDER